MSDIFHINLLIHIGLHITELQIVDLASIAKVKSFPNINFPSIHSMKNLGGATKQDLGGFHPQLLVFPFVYPFNSRTGVLVHSSIANDYFRRISTTFQHHFKICLLWFLQKKEYSFYTQLFYCTEMKWLFISSTAIWVTGSDTISVASRARTKLSVQNLIELEFELSRM